MSNALADRYRRFATVEAHGRSPLYEMICLSIADDPAVLAFLETLPASRRQPNLLLAAVRHVAGTARDWPAFRGAVLDQGEAVRSIMLTRTTQTNEPARCAVLLPVLGRLPQPLALIEVGASAGLCLLPDFYGYDYDGHRLLPAQADAPVFDCRTDAATPKPSALPVVAWRAGLDLAPVPADDPRQAAWLETLVWPEQTERLARLRSALRIAASVGPVVMPGDLLTDALERLCAQAPPDATLVVYHTAVLAYVAEQAGREAFAARVRRLVPYWIANEAASVLPGIAAAAGPLPEAGSFLLSVNGTPMAWTDPHGGSMQWIGGTGSAAPRRRPDQASP
ncbi:DUF2332 domain-containing protein [Rhodopila sp.]|jgi:hypothetical protein|uniref:DUF2332 domain-containing protein n=1 Tax=Rhodopila sp. TaxID=2480087 RepID=UPI002B84DA43|nr:DUF2332 domain-containing protein [Rhodopila sp.]HVZ09513.1 DUF2332 domain-containing protein [Rhodopila sp.]